MDKAKIEDKKALKNTKNPENWNSKPNSTGRISAIGQQKDLKNTKNLENWNSNPNSTGWICAIGQPAGPTIRLTPKCIPAE